MSSLVREEARRQGRTSRSGMGVWLRRQRARLRNRALGQALEAEFSGLSAPEHDRRLADIGLEPDDLVSLTAGRPIPPQLFSRMIRRLGLERALLGARPEVTARLTAHCRACDALPECETWLDDETAKEAPPTFCPNAEAFRGMTRAPEPSPPPYRTAH